MEMIFSKSIKEFTKEWKEDIKNRIIPGHPPILGIVQVGENPASTRYVNNKIKDCIEVGIDVRSLYLPKDISMNDFYNAFDTLRHESDGVIVQLPLPHQLDIEEIKRWIPAEKDVDGFLTDSPFDPCTPGGIIKYLDYCSFDLDGKNVVIVGRSDIVGKPLARMMTDRNATVTLCHSHTRNIYDFYRTADLIVSAVGKAGFLNCYPIYVPVVDVGINFVDGKLVGDCFNTKNRDVTPVPGGVGLLTRCMLLENVMRAAYER